MIPITGVLMESLRYGADRTSSQLLGACNSCSRSNVMGVRLLLLGAQACSRQPSCESGLSCHRSSSLRASEPQLLSAPPSAVERWYLGAQVL